MAVKLDSLIARTEAAIATESDPKKKLRLQSDLAIFTATKTRMDSSDGDDDGDEGDEDDEDDEDEDESKAKMAAKKAEQAKRKAVHAKHMEMAAKHKQKAAEYEEKAKQAMEGDEEDDEEDESEEASALVASGVPDAAAAAIAAQAALAQSAIERTTAIENKLAKREQDAAIKEALADGRITPNEAKMLGKKTPAWAAEYIATREGVRVVNVDESSIAIQPRELAAEPASAEIAEIDERIRMMGVKDPKQVESLRAEMVKNRRAAAVNGAGRY